MQVLKDYDISLEKFINETNVNKIYIYVFEYVNIYICFRKCQIFFTLVSFIIFSSEIYSFNLGMYVYKIQYYNMYVSNFMHEIAYVFR